MMDEDIRKFVDRYGAEAVVAKLRELDASGDADDTLTIVCNAGAHHAPSHVLRGHVFEATRGNLDFSSPASIARVYEEALTRLATLLKQKAWKKIYVLPFGHATLSMQIKLMVYRVTGMDTTDWFYISELGYVPLDLPMREIIVAAEPDVDRHHRRPR